MQQLITTMSSEEKRELLASRLRLGKLGGRPQPVSFQQQRMWFLHQMMPASSAYNIPAAVRLTGRLDVDAWQASLTRVSIRHDVLRTTFVEVDGQPFQQLHADHQPQMRVVDLREPVRASGLAVADLGHPTLRAAAVEEFTRPFDLEEGPLMRMCFLRTREDEHVLLMTTHHALADVWSTTVFLNELIADYTARQPWLRCRPSLCSISTTRLGSVSSRSRPKISPTGESTSMEPPPHSICQPTGRARQSAATRVPRCRFPSTSSGCPGCERLPSRPGRLLSWCCSPLSWEPSGDMPTRTT